MTDANAEIAVRKGARVNIKRIITSANLKDFERSQATLTETKETFTIRISAKDLTALRASINSILRELKVLEETFKAVPKEGGER